VYPSLMISDAALVAEQPPAHQIWGQNMNSTESGLPVAPVETRFADYAGGTIPAAWEHAWTTPSADERILALCESGSNTTGWGFPSPFLGLRCVAPNRCWRPVAAGTRSIHQCCAPCGALPVPHRSRSST
jgi:hypothetical protein